jgi:hypothetical protein
VPSHFARVALDEIRPAVVEDHVAALARQAPRQAELALRVLKQVLANAKERGHVVDEGVFVEDGDRSEFFVRAGNTSRPLDVKEASEYIKSHWATPALQPA